MVSRRSFVSAVAGGTLCSQAYGKAPADLPPGSDLQMWRTKVGVTGYSDTDTKQFRPRTADLGYISVPSDHFHPDPGGQVRCMFRLRFARFCALNPTREAPLFYLFGGPSSRSNDLWFFIDGGFRRNSATEAMIDTVTRHRDLVLIDQRGSAGCLYPKLPPVDGRIDLPFDRPVGLDERAAEYGRARRELVDYWRDAGVDLGLINSRQAAGDIDSVRRALGYGKIRLAGDSNGTYRARQYLRQFRGHVESALMLISHGYTKIPHVEHVRAALLRIEQAVARDPRIGRFVPSLTGLLDTLVSKMNDSPVNWRVRSGKHQGQDIVLDGTDLSVHFWTLFFENADILAAPNKLWRIRKGDYDEVAQTAAQARNARLPLSGFDESFTGAAARPIAAVNDYRKMAGDQLYLDREVEDFPSTWPLQRDPQAPFDSSVPITYLQGEWDLRTPVEGPQSLGEPMATLLINPRMGHDSVIDDADDSGALWEVATIDAFVTDAPIQPYLGFPSEFAHSEFTDAG